MQILKANILIFYYVLPYTVGYCPMFVFFFPISVTVPMAEPIKCPNVKGAALLERYDNMRCVGTHFVVSGRPVGLRENWQ